MLKVLVEIFQPAVVSGDKPMDNSLCEKVNYIFSVIRDLNLHSLDLFFPALGLTCRTLNLTPNHDLAVYFLLTWEPEVVRNHFDCSK